jgi:hypothetical protein
MRSALSFRDPDYKHSLQGKSSICANYKSPREAVTELKVGMAGAPMLFSAAKRLAAVKMGNFEEMAGELARL